jgi:hypothetical protein
MRSGVLKETAFPHAVGNLDTNVCKLMTKDRLPVLRR